MTNPKETPPQQYLSECLVYFPETGGLEWRRRPASHFRNVGIANRWNACFAGKPAFTRVKSSSCKYGYRVGDISGEVYLAHRIIWKMVYGIEADQIDHINGDGGDNRLDNIRSVTHAENLRNRKTKSRGIEFYGGKFKNGWRVEIWSIEAQKSIHIGRFNCLNHAIAARGIAESMLGFHENHGRGDMKRKIEITEEELVAVRDVVSKAIALSMTPKIMETKAKVCDKLTKGEHDLIIADRKRGLKRYKNPHNPHAH